MGELRYGLPRRLRLLPRRLVPVTILVFLTLGLVQLVASVLFYHAIDTETVRQDHARRVAELLVVADWLEDRGLLDVANIMTTEHLTVEIGPSPIVPTAKVPERLKPVHEAILKWEPDLASRPLHLGLLQGANRTEHLIGAIEVSEGEWLNFRSAGFSAGWPVVLRATVMTALLALAALLAGALILRGLGRPLRVLADASERIGEGAQLEFEVKGPADVQRVSRAFNDMQSRIGRLIGDQARAFEAISHDLRTPLGRMTLAADMVEDEDIRAIIDGSSREMVELLDSLRGFLRAQHLESVPESVDLQRLVADTAAPWADRLRIAAGDPAIVTTYREPVAIALAALIDNAVHFGGGADVAVEPDADQNWRIAVMDKGPGIPAHLHHLILDPFFRIDDARARDVAGFGLGIPTAHRLMQRFGGRLVFQENAGGGLRAVIYPPQPAIMPDLSAG